jgi:hypothetical protein
MSVSTFKIAVILYNIAVFWDIEMWFTSHLPIMFNISQFLSMRIMNDLIFLWIKVSSVVQTLSEAHKGKISNCQIICYYLFYLFYLFYYTITPVMKITTYIITSITASLLEVAAILAIMSVSTFKIAVNLYISLFSNIRL